MLSADPPLLELFYRLRDKHNWLLGIDEYMLVVHALQAGFGIENRQALEQLCCTLWAKSSEENRLLHYSFAQILEELPATIIKPTSPPLQPDVSSSVDSLQTASESASSISTPVQSPNLTFDADEPVVQVAQAVRRNTTRNDDDLERPRFNLVTEYFPVTRRQMKQSWRYLRRPVREGPKDELDIDTTVEQVGRDGFLLDPILRARRINRADLALLIDQDGSMVPFHILSRQFIETAKRGGRLGNAGVYYFHDYPSGYLYRDPAQIESLAIEEVLAGLNERVAVLILSDAGAARGNFDSERVTQTQKFIRELKRRVRYCAWLNPMPIQRWPHTTAIEIARLVPMFEMNRSGLDNAIGALRGRFVDLKATSYYG